LTRPTISWYNITHRCYRGYYYSTALGLYYLKSRFYDAEIGRFICADSLDYLDPHTVGGLNLFAYCNNNPVMNVDPTGHVFETIFNLFSLGCSVVEVVVNPTDPLAWLSLAGDALDLIPFVTGLGETVKGARIVAKGADLADDALDIVKIQKATDFTEDAIKATESLEQVGDFTKSTTSLGTRIHKGYKTFDLPSKEYRKKSGIRPDFYDGVSIFELKPYNRRALRQGILQLIKYKKVIGNGKMILEFYFKR